MKKATAGLLIVLGMAMGSIFTLALSPAGAASALVGAAAPPSGGHQSVLGQALDTLVGNGTINQTQADAVKNQVQTLEKQHPRGPGAPGHRGGFGPLSLGRDPLGQLATLLKTDPQTLMSDLAAGQSIADVAKAHGVDPASVVNALVAKANEGLTDAVSRGWLTQAQADALEAKLPDQIGAMVNQKWGGGWGHGPGPGLGLFGPGPGAGNAPPAGGAPTTTAPGSKSAPSTTAPPTTAAPSTTTPTTAPSTTSTTE
jgi:hypothetical protein